MDKNEQIKNEISQIWKILTSAKESYMFSNYLFKPDTKSEQEFLNNSQEFNFIRHTLWRMSIIELSKLLAERERFSIISFINKFKQDGYYGQSFISPEIINYWEKRISKNNDNIKQIINLRDKVYAHTDSNTDKHIQVSISFHQIKVLIKIIEDIIKEIYSEIFEGLAVMDSPIFDKKNFNIIKILSNEKERKIKEFMLKK